MIDVVKSVPQEPCNQLCVALYKPDVRFYVPFEVSETSDLADELVSSSRILDVGQWIPAVAPAPCDNFCGVNRSANPLALAGHRYRNNGGPLFEGILSATVQTFRFGGRPDTLVMNERNYRNYMIETSGFAKGDAHPGGRFEYICVEDKTEDVFILQSNTWTWHDIPTEFRWRGQLVCTAPGFNARLTP